MSPLDPWIHEYLIGIAEQYGVDYFNAPLHEKQKTVQIIEFLHRGSGEQDSNIWARISDSSRYIIAKFVPKAAQDYTDSLGKRLADHRTAIIRIKDFRPFFGRVPIGENRMSSNETLALECRSATPRGNFGERILGDPMNITSEKKIRMWIEGLNRGGGEGNILKQQRIEREQSNPEKHSDDRVMAPLLEQQNLDAIVRKSTAIPATRANSAKTVAANKPKAKPKPWKPRIPSVFEIPPEILATLRALPIEGEDITPSPPKHEGEVNDNNESPRKRRRNDNVEENMNDMCIDDEEYDERSSQPLSDWPISEHEDDVENDKSLNQKQPPDPPQIPVGLPTGSQHKYSPPANSTPSSLPPMSSFARMEAPISPSMPAPKLPLSQARSRVMRKVPPPKQPQELTQASGQGRVLAPASDVSMSQSQSQSRSQSQRHREIHRPGCSPMQIPGEEAEDTSLVETARRGTNRQVARKSSSQSSSKRDNQRWDIEQSHGRPDLEAKGMSDDDRETCQQFFGNFRKAERRGVEKHRSDDWELPPSKRSDINKSRAKPSGLQFVSTSDTTLTEMETPVQYDPGTWSRPSFMKENSPGTKLGGFVAGLSGLRKSEGERHAWLSWKELRRILEES